MHFQIGRGGGARSWRAALLLCCLAGCEGGVNADGSAPASDTATRAVAVGPELLAGLPPEVSATQVERGRELFSVCAVCHGLDAAGTQLGPDLRDPEWIHISGTIEEIAAIVREGVAEPRDFEVPMPVLGGGDFDAEEVEAIAAYVYALSRQPAGS